MSEKSKLLDLSVNHFKTKRIAEIRRIPSFLHGKEYEIELEPNYSFDFSGLDYAIVTTVHEVFEATKHIVFCDGV